MVIKLQLSSWSIYCFFPNMNDGMNVGVQLKKIKSYVCIWDTHMWEFSFPNLEFICACILEIFEAQ
jgi:hypothetical protein